MNCSFISFFHIYFKGIDTITLLNSMYYRSMYIVSFGHNVRNFYSIFKNKNTPFLKIELTHCTNALLPQFMVHKLRHHKKPKWWFWCHFGAINRHQKRCVFVFKNGINTLHERFIALFYGPYCREHMPNVMFNACINIYKCNTYTMWLQMDTYV